MSDPAAAPFAPASRVLFVGHKIDDAVRRFLDTCSQRGWQTLRVADVYLAMGHLASQSTAPFDQVVVDSRVLNAGEERFLSLARRYYPRLVVRRLDETLAPEQLFFPGAKETIQSPPPSCSPHADSEATLTFAAPSDRNLSAERPPHPQPRRESTPDALREVIDRAWRAAHAEQSGLKHRTDPRHAAPGSDEPAGPSSLNDDEPFRPLTPTPDVPPPHFRDGGGRPAQQTEGTKSNSVTATPQSSPKPPATPNPAGDTETTPPANGAVPSSAREPSLHDAVRMRMRAAASGADRPIVRIPPGGRTPPPGASQPTRPPVNDSPGSELTREELDSLLGDASPQRDGGSA